MIDNPSSTPTQRSASYHSLGNIAAILADFHLSAHYHYKGKETEPKTLPPLAIMHQNGEPCNEIGDIFWVSSFTKKQMFDLFYSEDSRPEVVEGSYPKSIQDILDDKLRQTLSEAHSGLGTQLEDSGLVDLAMLHFERAYDIGRGNDVRVKRALQVPVLYDNISHVEKSREKLLDGVAELKYEGVILSSLNQLSVPGTFYIVYQGFNDRDVMVGIRENYYRMYPAIDKSDSDGKLGALLDGKLRVGFVSNYFRQHSVCKLFCGIIESLDKHKFHPILFSGTTGKDSWTEKLVNKIGEENFIDLSRQGFLLSNTDMISSQNLDVIIYLDVGMDTGSALWAHSRFAKVRHSETRSNEADSVNHLIPCCDPRSPFRRSKPACGDTRLRRVSGQWTTF